MHRCCDTTDRMGRASLNCKKLPGGFRVSLNCKYLPGGFGRRGKKMQLTSGRAGSRGFNGRRNPRNYQNFRAKPLPRPKLPLHPVNARYEPAKICPTHLLEAAKKCRIRRFR